MNPAQWRNYGGARGGSCPPYETSAPRLPPRWRCAQYIISVKVKAWSLYILYWLMNNIKFRADEQKRSSTILEGKSYMTFELMSKKRSSAIWRVKVTKLTNFRLIFLPDFFVVPPHG